MQEIAWTLQILGSLLLGYALGKGNIKEEAENLYTNASKRLDKSPSGPVHRPNNHQLEKFHNPQKYEEEEAFNESFKDNKEIQQALEIARAKREGYSASTEYGV